MTLTQAASLSGFSVYTLAKKARASAFFASKPRGNRGGWVVSDRSFRLWLEKNRSSRGNAAMREATRRGVNVNF